MTTLSTVITLVAIGWVIAQLLTTRRRLRNGEIVVPPLFAATLVFLLFILLVWAVGASPHAPVMVVSTELCARNRGAAFPSGPTARYGMLGAVGRA